MAGSQDLPTSPYGGGGGGGGAPTTAQYVTLAVDGTLTNERVLTAGANITLTDGGAGSTVTVAALSGAVRFNTVTTAATPYAVTSTDNIVFANAAVAQTINIPAAAAGLTGRTITVKRIGINAPAVTVATLGGLIDGASTRSLNNYDSITVVCDGTNWWTI
jgi:hypothetical protein